MTSEQETDRTSHEPPKPAIAKKMIFQLQVPLVVVGVVVGAAALVYVVGAILVELLLDHYTDITEADGTIHDARFFLGIFGTIGVGMIVVLLREWYRAAKFEVEREMKINGD